MVVIDDLPGERWGTVPIDTGYQVSTCARARSLDRYIKCKAGPDQFHRGQLLRTPIGAQGYPIVNLGGGVSMQIGRLMLMTFVSMPPFEGAEARHLNDNRLDNRLENLVWGSRQDNAADQERNWQGYVRRVKCRYGHRKVAPNLVQCMLPDRSCLACNRAHSRRRSARERGVAIGSHQEVSDRYYRAIMGEEAA